MKAAMIAAARWAWLFAKMGVLVWALTRALHAPAFVYSNF